MEDRIKAAIVAYLEENTCAAEGKNDWFLQFNKPIEKMFLSKIATEISAVITPLVNVQAQDFAGWICHQVVAGRTYHKLWLDYCEEKNIASLVHEALTWEDAPDWAEYRTIDDDGMVVYWGTKPYTNKEDGTWTHRDARVEFKEVKYHHPDWENSLQQRPK